MNVANLSAITAILNEEKIQVSNLDYDSILPTTYQRNFMNW